MDLLIYCGLVVFVAHFLMIMIIWNGFNCKCYLEISCDFNHSSVQYYILLFLFTSLDSMRLIAGCVCFNISFYGSNRIDKNSWEIQEHFCISIYSLLSCLFSSSPSTLFRFMRLTSRLCFKEGHIELFFFQFKHFPLDLSGFNCWLSMWEIFIFDFVDFSFQIWIYSCENHVIELS